MSLELANLVVSSIIAIGGIIVGVKLNSKQNSSIIELAKIKNQMSLENMIFKDKYLLILDFKYKVGKCFSNYWNFVEFLKNYNYYELADINNDPYHKYVKLFDSEVRELVEKYYMIRSELDDEIRVSAHKIIIAFQKLVSSYKEDQRDCSYQGVYQMNFLLESLDKLNNEISHFNEVSIKLTEKLINIDVQ